MAERYDHRAIEKQAQEKWAALDLYTTDLTDTSKDPYYLLFEFPYPSGDLHIGHWYAFAITDIFARMKRMQGKNVLFPIGFDAFGLPAENAAMKNGTDPREWTYANMDRMREQIKSMGTSVDWSKEVVTCDPEYYHWTQWLFAKLYEHGLAERKQAAVKWCPKDKTVLANEQVIDGHCERCGTAVEERKLTQWFMKITQYAERLLSDLDALPWREEIKDAQRAWIGKSEGAKLRFPIAAAGKKYVMLHGFCGSPTDGYFPWVKQVLEAQGAEVITPALPQAKKPNEQDWVSAALAAADYDENTVLFGWSLGAVTALKVAEQLKSPIAKLVLAGGFVDPEFKDNPRNFEETFSWDFDWRSIKANVGEIVILHDVNDPAVSSEQADRIEQASGIAVRRVVAQDGHFDGDQEPEVLSALLSESGKVIEVFTTRPDTLYGATYVVLAPEHSLVTELLSSVSNKQEVAAYVEATKRKTERERSENKEKTGVELKGVLAKNPANGEAIPVYVADYVLGSYGTGAVMAVPAHDERDFEFAQKYALPIKTVVIPHFIDKENPWQEGKELVKRNAVLVIVRNPATSKYIGLKWKKQPWTTFITGGIDAGEDAIEAARREVREETGYKNLTYVRTLGYTQSEFYAAHKGINRIAVNTIVLFDLENEERDEVDEEERQQHEAFWLDFDDIAAEKMRHSEIEYIRERMERPAAADTGDGVLMDSGEFSGRDNREAMWDIVKAAGGERVTNYRIRDWLVSRQRYWGCPIPVVYDPEGKPHLVPAEHLPWLLPTDVDFTPNGSTSLTTGDAASPLATSQELKDRVTKLFGEGWTPEYDTLDTFVDSSWYFLRYLDPKDNHDFSDQSMLRKWMPVERYSGGSEHTTMHLLYARFFTMALHDLALVPVDEPFAERYNRGIILGPDGAKMSKSKGNVINPDDVVKEHGADAVRMYLAFIGPYNEPGHYPWNLDGVYSMRKFLDRIVALYERRSAAVLGEDVLRMLARAESKVSTESERFKFNTALSALMVLVRDLEELTEIPVDAYADLIRLTAPFAPHLMEHLWSKSGGEGSVHAAPWPSYDATLLVNDTVTIGVQVNGKRRGDIQLAVDAGEAEAVAEARKLGPVEAALGGKDPARVVYVPGKILNLVGG
ncbi:MAG TPA: class I tRNA ligase family protein [Candidatus Paceibacterota bacterium]|nr:class I tRNA ligase family protein [Candidatus Paceibacterota bacterium]